MRKPTYSLHLNAGMVEVFQNPGPAEPALFGEREACLALLARDDLLAACKAFLAGHASHARDCGVFDHSLATQQQAAEAERHCTCHIAAAREAVRKAEGA